MDILAHAYKAKYGVDIRTDPNQKRAAGAVLKFVGSYKEDKMVVQLKEKASVWAGEARGKKSNVATPAPKGQRVIDLMQKNKKDLPPPQAVPGFREKLAKRFVQSQVNPKSHQVAQGLTERGIDLEREAWREIEKRPDKDFGGKPGRRF
tara:strand:+ start:11666 stop:12112 length:447 start_codon:yes stop_codon:yes gene_type:complete